MFQLFVTTAFSQCKQTVNNRAEQVVLSTTNPKPRCCSAFPIRPNLLLELLTNHHRKQFSGNVGWFLQRFSEFSIVNSLLWLHSKSWYMSLLAIPLRNTNTTTAYWQRSLCGTTYPLFAYFFYLWKERRGRETYTIHFGCCLKIFSMKTC